MLLEQLSTYVRVKVLFFASCKVEVYELESCVRGHHVYGRVWRATVDEQSECKPEPRNQDLYAVAVLKNDAVVGHVPRKISAACTMFIRKRGTINCVVKGRRRYSSDLPQGGLEIPCVYRMARQFQTGVKNRDRWSVN